MPALMRACTHVRMNRARDILYLLAVRQRHVCVCVCVRMRARYLCPLGPRQTSSKFATEMNPGASGMLDGTERRRSQSSTSLCDGRAGDLMSTGERARQDAQGRILLQSRSGIVPSGPAPHPGGRERVPICSSARIQSPDAEREDRISARVCAPVSTALVPRYSTVTMEWAGVGVGMILEPSSDPGSDYCHVSSMKDGGALANDGRVKPGDKLVRVDGFDCMGVPRAVIKSRVLGPPNSEVVLEFQRDRRVFKVTLLRQAQLLSSNVRNSVSGSTTRQAENGDREQCLERSAWSQAAERFRGSLSSDKKQGNGRDRNRDADRTGDAEGRDRGRQETCWGQARDAERQRGRAVSPLRGQRQKGERERERARNRDSGEVRGGDAGGYWRDDKGRKDAGRDAHGR